jgi:4-aminobutyrate aminotransferase-like enzyme
MTVALDTETDGWILDTLRRYEPAAVGSQLPVIWHDAVGARVVDEQGRSWLDWTSGILTANAGHARPEVVAAICAQARGNLLHAYAFPTAVRARFVRALCELTGYPQVVLTTTGSEAAESSLKIARTYAFARGRKRALIVTFEGAFHGRTMGAQLAGGVTGGRGWTGPGDDIFVRVPFPGRGRSWSTGLVEDELRRRGAAPGDVAAVICEVYQGKTLDILDAESAGALRGWCDTHGIVLIVDEIQSGFGRTGALFACEHVGIRADILLCGKGLSGSLPLAALLLADADYPAALGPGELGSTHAANPVVLAAAEANLALFTDGSLVSHAAAQGRRLAAGLAAWERRQPHRRRVVATLGMVAGFTLLDDDGRPDPVASRRLAAAGAEHGLLLCVPVGLGGALLKAMPPLTISAADLDDSLTRLEAASEQISPSGGQKP